MHLVRLRRLVENTGINGSSHQVVGSCDGVNVTGEMKVELKRTKLINKMQFCFLTQAA